MPITNNLGGCRYSPLVHKHEPEDINGVTVSATEMNYLSGAKSNLQEQIDNVEKVNNRTTVVLTGIQGTTFTIGNSEETYSGTIPETGSVSLYVYYMDDYTITYSLGTYTNTITYTVDYVGTHNVNIAAVTTFANDNYTIITNASKAGLLPSYYAVGDTKEVVLNGTVGALTFSSTKTYMQILAFDHNSETEMNGESHIICGFGKSALSGGADVCFVDSYYSNTSSSQRFNMNLSATNSGGWASSTMRTVICAAFKNALPSDLQEILRSRTIYSDNTGGGSNTASYVTATTDTVYIPSEFEVQGARTYANSAEQNYQKQLIYYSDGNSKIRYKHSDTSTAAYWWVRSAHYNNNNYFCVVNTAGGVYSNSANFSYGFVPLITL